MFGGFWTTGAIPHSGTGSGSSTATQWPMSPTRSWTRSTRLFSGGPVSEDVTVSEALVAAGLSGSRLEAVEAAAQDMAQLHTSEMSARAAAEMRRMVKPTTPVFSLVDGYTRLWEALSQSIKDVIHLESPVSALEWSAEGVVAHVPGGAVEARTAIVTLPVGVLRDETVKFNPALPPRKRKAIDGLKMGPSIKLVAELRRPWWEDRLGPVANFETDIYPFTMPFFSVFWDRPGPATLAHIHPTG